MRLVNRSGMLILERVLLLKTGQQVRFAALRNSLLLPETGQQVGNQYVAQGAAGRFLILMLKLMKLYHACLHCRNELSRTQVCIN